MSDFHIKVRAELTADFLSSILITAFDGDHGGSWYWADTPASIGPPMETDDEAEVWYSVKIVDKECEDQTVHKVTHAVLAKGIQMLIDEGDDNIQQAVFDDDAGMIDANDADTIVQFGLFERCIYG